MFFQRDTAWQNGWYIGSREKTSLHGGEEKEDQCVLVNCIGIFPCHFYIREKAADDT